MFGVILPAEWEGDGVPIAWAVSGVRADDAAGNPFCALIGVLETPAGALRPMRGRFGALPQPTFSRLEWGVIEWPNGRAICLDAGLRGAPIPGVRLVFPDVDRWLPALRSWAAPFILLADGEDPRMVDAAMNGHPGPAVNECEVAFLPFPPIDL